MVADPTHTASERQAILEELYCRHQEPLRGSVLHLVGPDLADDVVQTVFLRICRCRDASRIRRIGAAYLRRAVRNEALHILSRGRTVDDVRAALRVERRGVSDPAEAERLRDLAAAEDRELRALPIRARETFVLVAIMKMSHRAAAELLDVSTKAVEKQMTKARKLLQRNLQREWIEQRGGES